MTEDNTQPDEMRADNDSRGYERLYGETIPSTVSIYARVETESGSRPTGSGSGFVYDDEGHVVTNQHVVTVPTLARPGEPRRRGSPRKNRQSDTSSVVGREVEMRFSEGEWRTGEVVGVNRAKRGENIGFAISPTIVTLVVPDLIATGSYRHSYLNVRMVDVSPTVADANDLDEPTGVLVVDVRLGPASGGLVGCRDTRVVRGYEVPVGGDVIVGIGGRDVRSHEELMRYLITETEPSEAVTVELIRDGESFTEQITLGERPSPDASSSYDIPVR